MLRSLEFIGHPPHGAGTKRTQSCGLIIGQVYEGRIEKSPYGYNVFLFNDSDGDPRRRRISEFADPSLIRRAWARFPSLQKVFG